MSGIILVVDLGSTSIKTIAFDESKRIRKARSSTNYGFYRDPKERQWFYIDPRQFWHETARSIKNIVQGTISPGQIEAICVTGFGAEGLPISAKGQELYPIMFFDRRTDFIVDRINRRYEPKEIFATTGKQVLPMDTVVRMLWMKGECPGTLKAADKWLMAVDYINFRLCGRMATDQSMASCTGAFDIKKGTWAEGLLKQYGIRASLLPEVHASGHILGGVSRGASEVTGLLEGTPVILGGHDFHCANIAAGGGDRDCIVDILGTWECVVGISNSRRVDPRLAPLGIAIERTVDERFFTLMNSNVAGDIVDWFIDILLGKKGKKKAAAVKDLQEESRKLNPGENGVFFLPHLFGSNSPVIDPFSRGAFVGIGRKTETECLYLAILEGLNYQFREMLQSLEKALGSKKRRIRVVGGGSRNALWMQNKADTTNRVIEVPRMEEATALGAALIAEVGLKKYRTLEDACKSVKTAHTRYRPNTERSKKYNECYENYKKIYPALKELNRSISIGTSSS